MEGDRWGHISKAPAQPAPAHQAEAPASPSQSRERPRLTLAPRSDEAPSSQDALAQPKKKVHPPDTAQHEISFSQCKILPVVMLSFTICSARLSDFTSADGLGTASQRCLLYPKQVHWRANASTNFLDRN